MEITIDQALQGLRTNIKGKEYFKTSNYIEPFLERMSKFTNDFRIQAKLPDQITYTENGDINFENITYNRVWVEAILPDEYAMEGHKQSVSLLYALDTRKPIYKIFKNTVRMACLNMCVFNPEHLLVQELEPESAMNYNFATAVMEMTDYTKAKLEMLANTFIKRNELTDYLGKWVDNSINYYHNNGFGKVKLAESLAIDAYKDLVINPKSEYYTAEGDICMFDAYNSFTNLISNDKGKDIVNKFEKSYLVSQILGI